MCEGARDGEGGYRNILDPDVPESERSRKHRAVKTSVFPFITDTDFR